jgi:hypothetical protein
MFNRRFLYAALISAFAIFFHINALAQSESRSKTIKDLNSLNKELSKKEEALLSPSAEDRAAFAEFLKQPHTGLIRILPRGLYEDMLNIRGGGAYYSFTRLTHEYGYGSDIELWMVPHNPNNDDAIPPIPEYRFHTGFAGADYGFIVRLGDVPIEEVTLGYDEIKYLVDYRPPSREPEVRAEQRRVLGVIQNGRFENPSTVPVHVNCTYALRSINFDRSDVLVAFRVVRQETDGSVLLLWKRLKQFSTPALLR